MSIASSRLVTPLSAAVLSLLSTTHTSFLVSSSTRALVPLPLTPTCAPFRVLPCSHSHSHSHSARHTKCSAPLRSPFRGVSTTTYAAAAVGSSSAPSSAVPHSNSNVARGSAFELFTMSVLSSSLHFRSCPFILYHSGQSGDRGIDCYGSWRIPNAKSQRETNCQARNKGEEEEVEREQQQQPHRLGKNDEELSVKRDANRTHDFQPSVTEMVYEEASSSMPASPAWSASSNTVSSLSSSVSSICPPSSFVLPASIASSASSFPASTYSLPVLVQCKLERKTTGAHHVRALEGVLAQHTHRQEQQQRQGQGQRQGQRNARIDGEGECQVAEAQHEKKNTLIGVLVSGSEFSKEAVAHATRSPVPLVLVTVHCPELDYHLNSPSGVATVASASPSSSAMLAAADNADADGGDPNPPRNALQQPSVSLSSLRRFTLNPAARTLAPHISVLKHFNSQHQQHQLLVSAANSALSDD